MSRFTEEAVVRLKGPDWMRKRRTQAWKRFSEQSLPTESEEVWRYSPINRLDLDAYLPVVAAPAGAAGETPAESHLHDLGSRIGLVTIVNGWPNEPAMSLPDGVSVGLASQRADGPGLIGNVLQARDALAALHDAFVPDAVIIEVAAGAMPEDPLILYHGSTGPAVPSPSSDGDLAQNEKGMGPALFPHTVVRLERGAQLRVVELFDGFGGTSGKEGQDQGKDDRALLLPVTELTVAQGAVLSYASVQTLGTGAWTLGRLSATVAQDASLRAFTAGFGAGYDRLRTDVALTGRGASSELCSVYLGTADQVHDVRTLQDHVAPSTVSDLLCKGAVAGSARSIYSGLIRMRPGAVHADAMQSNHNLVLGEDAHADSVPNLDIQENDVRCSHASSVGPVDSDQIFYLESRGVPPERAERLIVLGFFNDIIQRCPVPSLQPRLRQEVGLRMVQGFGELTRDGAVAEAPAGPAGAGAVGPGASR